MILCSEMNEYTARVSVCISFFSLVFLLKFNNLPNSESVRQYFQMLVIETPVKSSPKNKLKFTLTNLFQFKSIPNTDRLSGSIFIH